MRTPILIAAALALAAGFVAVAEPASARGWRQFDRSHPPKVLVPERRAAPYPYWYYGRPQAHRFKRRVPPPFYIEPSPRHFGAPMSRHHGRRPPPTFGLRR